MRKAERLFQLLTLLRGRRTALTAQAMAEVLEVSERTIYRDIQALSFSGVPIEGEAGVGYRLSAGFHLPPLMFNEDELEALLLGVRLVQGCSDHGLGQAAANVLDKVRAVLPEHLHSRYFDQAEWMLVPGFNRQWTTQFSDQIRQAIKDQQVIMLSYRREDKVTSERLVLPLGLVYWGTVWTVVAWCQLRKDYRMFCLDRILALNETDEYFETSSTLSLQHYLEQMRQQAAKQTGD